MSVDLATTIDEDILRERLERLIPATLDRSSAIICSLRGNDPIIQAPIIPEMITVQLVQEKLQLFLKTSGSGFLKDEAKQRRDRGRSVCQYLARGTDLGVGKYRSVWDESQGTFWLLLEFVNGVEVRFCEFEYWIAAAGWLGRLQGYFTQHSDRLSACDFLVRHDTDFFQSRAELALREVSQISIPLAGRIASILDHYDRIVDVMASQPPLPWRTSTSDHAILWLMLTLNQ